MLTLVAVTIRAQNLETERKAPRRPFIALKTNLLFDLALMPNIEAEVPIGNRWSVNGELMFPWWLFEGDKYCLQILSGGLEGRYWLGSRKIATTVKFLSGTFSAYMPEVASTTFNGTVTAIKASFHCRRYQLRLQHAHSPQP